MRLALTHAFSTKNAGDGLLVDLSLALLRDAGHHGPVRLLALEADSFGALAASGVEVRQVPGEPVPRPSRALVSAGVEVLRSAAREVITRPSHIERLLDGCDGLLAVGGGYLVADSVVRSGGVMANHLPQILAAGHFNGPTVYLPQSIGPLVGPVGALTKRALSRVDVVYVRDDETLRELAGTTTLVRCPDLAVLALAHTFADRRAPKKDGDLVVVPRDLPRAPGLDDRMRALGRALAAHGDVRFAVQADVDGERSDAAYLRRLGVPSAGPLKSVLAGHGVVVSVRLHGAIQALLAGWPAIHLSYERKGFGAYEDLGLAEFVHDARAFDVDVVVAQAARLRREPELLFEKLAPRIPALNAARKALVDDVRRRFAL